MTATRSVLGRVQCLELTGGQGLVKGLPTNEHIGQEYPEAIGWISCLVGDLATKGLV